MAQKTDSNPMDTITFFQVFILFLLNFRSCLELGIQMERQAPDHAYALGMPNLNATKDRGKRLNAGTVSTATIAIRSG
jgi:hypothetical protein